MNERGKIQRHGEAGQATDVVERHAGDSAAPRFDRWGLRSSQGGRASDCFTFCVVAFFWAVDLRHRSHTDWGELDANVVMLVVLLGASLAFDAARAAEPECRRSGELEFVCDIKNAEDLVRVPATPWIIASGFAAAAGISLIDSRNATHSSFIRMKGRVRNTIRCSPIAMRRRRRRRGLRTG
jgi:hypothetical protein